METLKLARLVAAQTFWKVEELVEVQRCGGSPEIGWRHEKREGQDVALENSGRSVEVGGSSSSLLSSANFVFRFGSLLFCFANLLFRFARALFLPQ